MAVLTEIVDAHHHLWNPATNDPDVGYIWLKDIGAPKPFGDPTPIQRDYLPDEFLAEAKPTRIAASVHLQADGAIPDPVAETKFVDRLASSNAHDLAIVGFVDLASPDAQDKIEAHMAASTMFRGIRQIISRLDKRPDISFAARDYLEDSRWRDQFALLGEAGLSFDLQCYPEQMHAAADFFSDYPDVSIIIDHAGSPWDQSPTGLERLEEGLARLASLPNTTIKLCGFGMFDRNWNALSILPIFRIIEGLFGPSRMMFASNFPVDKLMRSYADILSDMVELTAGWDDTSKTDFFSGNARRIYRF